jgi:hypothetical protein
MDEKEMEGTKEVEGKKEARPRKKYRDILITPGMVGFKVKIGCAELYYANPKTLLKDLVRYLREPDITTREFLSKDQRLIADAPQAPEYFGTTSIPLTGGPLSIPPSSYFYTGTSGAAGIPASYPAFGG